MDHDTYLLLLGAGIALVSTLVAAVAQHLLSLRADRITRAQDKLEEETKTRRRHLQLGTDKLMFMKGKPVSIPTPDTGGVPVVDAWVRVSLVGIESVSIPTPDTGGVPEVITLADTGDVPEREPGDESTEDSKGMATEDAES